MSETASPTLYMSAVAGDPSAYAEYRRILKTAAAAGIPVEYAAGNRTRAYPSREAFEAAALT